MTIQKFDYPDGTTSIAGATLVDGDYVIANKRFTKGGSNPTVLFNDARDGSVTVDLHNLGVTFNNAFIVMRTTDTSNLILFGLAPGEGDGGARCRIYIKENGENTIASDELYSGFTDPDLSKESPVYRMTAVCDGTDLKLYINDELVCTATDTSSITGTGIGLRADNALLQFDNFRYTSEILTPSKIITQTGKATAATKLGELLPIHSQIAAAGASEEFWPYPMSTADIPNWPTTKYPLIFPSSADHGSGLGGIYVRVYNAELGAVTESVAWEEWQNVSSRNEFDHIETKTCPIYVDSDFDQTETPTWRVIDGVVNMTYHTRGVLVDGYPEGVQNTHLATSANGIDFTRAASSVITYNPKFEQGDGHTGYAKPIPNPLTKYPYDYITIASHGGGSDGTGGAALYGANSWSSWEFIKLIGSSLDTRITDHAPAGWEGVKWGARINSLQSLTREGEYWRCIFNLRVDNANGGDTIPYLPVELLIDDEFNVVSQPNVFVELGGNGEFDEGEILHYTPFDYEGKKYAFYKGMPLSENSTSSIGLLEINETSYDWKIFQTLAEKDASTYDVDSYETLSLSANTSASVGDGLVKLSVPASGDSVFATATPVTPSSHAIVELAMKRHGRMVEADIGGFIGLVDDETNIQNGIIVKWPTNATGDDYLRVSVFVGGVETEYVTEEVLSRLAGGSIDYVMSKKSYGFRIDTENRLVQLMDGRAIAFVQDIDALDLTQALTPVISHYSDTATLGEVAFESLEVATFSSDARALRPIANAGIDQTDVVAGQVVTLDGSLAAAVAPATIVSYQWVQIGGESVTLSDATAVNPTFTAPNIDMEQALTFSLTVIDSNGLVSDADLVNVDMIVISTINMTLTDIPDGTYKTRVIVPSTGVVFMSDTEWVDGSASISLPDVAVGTAVEYYSYDKDTRGAGLHVEGVTE